jgi:HD-GYP domain-containing protein (c-di-GMP phosphodiesterase class II)
LKTRERRSASRRREDPLLGIWGALDMVVLEEVAGSRTGSCRVLTGVPDWAAPLLRDATNGVCKLGSTSHFLEHFLHDAHDAWHRKEGKNLRSGPFIETADGKEIALEAIAVRHDGRRILLLRRLGEDYEAQVAMLQRARQNRLEQESLEAEVLRRTADIRQREEEIALRLMAATAVRDRETGGHVRRIGLYSAVVAAALGWDRLQVHDIRVAAPMHDIGKIGVPDHILLKPGKLTAAERKIMERHTDFGAKLLESPDISLLRMARDIALAHHERWDGRGYPRGLRGLGIPDSARIVSVVDVYDAMTHQRPYKRAIAEDRVIAHLEQESGRLFDPAVVGAFTSQIDEIRRIRAQVHDDAPPFDVA